MSEFIKIKPEEFNTSAFRLIGSDWMLITAEKDQKINTMTAAWGGFGVMWNKNVAYTVIRPTRYTKEFVDNAETFSLTFFDNSFKKQLSYLGSVSGRDEDKITKSGLTLSHTDNTPYFEEANIVIICKKLYAQDLQHDCFIKTEIDEKCYPDKDYHTLYISEIKEILIKK